MKQANEKTESTEKSSGTTGNATRKGLHRFFHVSRLDLHICAIVAMVFSVFGFIELLGIAKLTFIRMSNSFQFALLFGILGMVSRIYYKMFEEQYDMKK